MSDIKQYVDLLWANNKIIIIGFVIMLIAIPSGTAVIGWRIKAVTEAPLPAVFNSKQSTITATPSASLTPTQTLLQEALSELKKEESQPTPSPMAEAKISFGPTMDFKVSIEGRPAGKNQSKLFVGIAKGAPTSKPTYLLSFNVDLIESGEFNGLSLAGLDQGENYTAYLKGSAQIATSSAFVVSPTITKLNGGTALNLITGDLNEDNVINAADYSIAKAAFGAKPGSSKWNQNIDFNLDNIINLLDLAIVEKNMGRSGTSGAWYSQGASGSATLNTVSAVGSVLSVEGIKPPTTDAPGAVSRNGYWIWVPAD